MKILWNNQKGFFTQLQKLRNEKIIKKEFNGMYKILFFNINNKKIELWNNLETGENHIIYR